MNRVIIACTLLSVAAAAVIPEDAQAQIVNYENDNDGLGNYEFSFETSNGIKREERGRLVNVGQEDEHIVVEGSYSFLDDTGKLVFIRYTADENGYKIGPAPVDKVSYALPAGLVASLLG
ncbi:endocuticle structural glycoprotein SgAbd-5 isoform X3 [Helicoverpa armigera]|uniref:endocuticle structural glycoprotein SgAbd-5 isoform X3 n=1 Tax=Helicoverpa armigera TaxID=29058 RepID=UPI0030836E22